MNHTQHCALACRATCFTGCRNTHCMQQVSITLDAVLKQQHDQTHLLNRCSATLNNTVPLPMNSSCPTVAAVKMSATAASGASLVQEETAMPRQRATLRNKTAETSHRDECVCLMPALDSRQQHRHTTAPTCSCVISGRGPDVAKQLPWQLSSPPLLLPPTQPTNNNCLLYHICAGQHEDQM
jgi:hypothetical protein